MRDEVILPQFREPLHGVLTDYLKYLKIIGIARIGKTLRSVDTAYVLCDEFSYLVAHPAVFHDGDEAGHQ